MIFKQTGEHHLGALCEERTRTSVPPRSSDRLIRVAKGGARALDPAPGSGTGAPEAEAGIRKLGISLRKKRPSQMAFRNALPPREQALAELAMCDPADLSKVQKLRVIHSRCAQAGVLTGASVSSASATAHAASAAGDGASDVAKLHQLFDAAVANGMPQLVCHYVDEVCGHDDFSSPDGVEAYLQDGEMVAEWAASSLRSAEQALDQAAALRTQGAADEVDRAGAVFEALRDVLEGDARLEVVVLQQEQLRAPLLRLQRPVVAELGRVLLVDREGLGAAALALERVAGNRRNVIGNVLDAGHSPRRRNHDFLDYAVGAFLRHRDRCRACQRRDIQLGKVGNGLFERRAGAVAAGTAAGGAEVDDLLWHCHFLYLGNKNTGQ